jgi:hypothetical protein
MILLQLRSCQGDGLQKKVASNVAGSIGDLHGYSPWVNLYLSPIGLSFVTKVAPAKMLSMMMGMWFLSSFFGNYLGGFIGEAFYEKMPKRLILPDVLCGNGCIP